MLKKMDEKKIVQKKIWPKKDWVEKKFGPKKNLTKKNLGRNIGRHTHRAMPPYTLWFLKKKYNIQKLNIVVDQTSIFQQGQMV